MKMQCIDLRCHKEYTVNINEETPRLAKKMWMIKWKLYRPTTLESIFKQEVGVDEEAGEGYFDRKPKQEDVEDHGTDLKKSK